MKKAIAILLLMMMVGNAYAFSTQSVSITNDIMDSVKDGIVKIIKAGVTVIKNLLGAVADAITYPFRLLADNFSYSSSWWNSTLGGFSPLGYTIVIALTIGVIFWFVDKYVDIGLG